MTAILCLFVAHWVLSIFAQTFFLHRYGAHRMFTMSPAWERCFYLLAFVAQGPSFLVPRAYAILHRQHHTFADTEKDPHSPRFFSNVASMMWHTKHQYDVYAYRRGEPEARFLGGTSEWPFIDRLSQRWSSRIALALLFVLFYAHFAPSLWWFLLLPVHWTMGPIHGAIVNWCGHRYGYRNFNTEDDSKNTLPLEFITMGELFQNNHHQFPTRPNFAVRWFELDPAYQVMRVLAWLRIIHFVPPTATVSLSEVREQAAA
ncbi:MAG: acyl-CoA desaturase [Myxococcaceae bacterium]